MLNKELEARRQAALQRQQAARRRSVDRRKSLSRHVSQAAPAPVAAASASPPRAAFHARGLQGVPGAALQGPNANTAQDDEAFLFLCSVPLMRARCNDAALRALARGLVRKQFAGDTAIIMEGASKPLDLFFIARGQVSIRKRNPAARDKTDLGPEVYRMRAGNFFGEDAIFSGKSVRTASVVTAEPSVLYVLEPAKLQTMETAGVHALSEVVRIRQACVPVSGVRSRNDVRVLRSLVAGVDFFAKLSRVVLTQALQRMSYALVDRGFTFFRRNDPGDALYVLLSGRVNVYAEGHGEVEDSPCPAGDEDLREPRERFLASLPAGRAFGELALINSNPRNATVRAAQASEVFSIRKDAFDEILRENSMRALEDKVDFLRSLPLLAPLLRRYGGDAHGEAFEAKLTELCNVLVVKRYTGKVRLLAEGQAPELVYICRRGALRVLRSVTTRAPDSFRDVELVKKVPVSLVGVGGVVGAAEALAGEPMPADVFCDGRVELLACAPDDFAAHMPPEVLDGLRAQHELRAAWLRERVSHVSSVAGAGPAAAGGIGGEERAAAATTGAAFAAAATTHPFPGPVKADEASAVAPVPPTKPRRRRPGGPHHHRRQRPQRSVGELKTLLQQPLQDSFWHVVGRQRGRGEGFRGGDGGRPLLLGGPPPTNRAGKATAAAKAAAQQAAARVAAAASQSAAAAAAVSPRPAAPDTPTVLQLRHFPRRPRADIAAQDVQRFFDALGVSFEGLHIANNGDRSSVHVQLSSQALADAVVERHAGKRGREGGRFAKVRPVLVADGADRMFGFVGLQSSPLRR